MPQLPHRYDLTGKVCLITGAAGLLGRQHALALAETGATVVVTDLDLERAETVCQELRQSGAQALALVMNVTEEASIKLALAHVLDQYGSIDVLVNNAAIDPKLKGNDVVETSRLESFPIDQWNFQISVGLTGAFLASRVFGGWMAVNGGGVILNIASDLAVIAPDQRLYRKDGLPADQQPVKPVTYSVIKTALLGLTRYLASYWADRGIRVNALSPGGVYAGQADEFVARLSQLIPMGRMAERNEYREAVQFLCSSASSYMTGQNIVIDGGRSIL